MSLLRKANPHSQKNANSSQNPPQPLNMKAKDIVKKYINPSLKDEELAYLYYVAGRLGLDPALKEIVILKFSSKNYESRPVLYITHAGALKIANNHPQFDAMVSDVVRKGDILKKTQEGVEHIYGEERGEILGAYCLVYRKDRRFPIYIYLDFEEAKQNSPTWTKYPSIMLKKTVERLALLRAFSVMMENFEIGSSLEKENQDPSIIEEAVILE